MSKPHIQEYFQTKFAGKTVSLLGFGREGKSSYRALRHFVPGLNLTISDSNPYCSEEFANEFGADPNVIFYCGDEYLNPLFQSDIIIKSPGISLKVLANSGIESRITSQTEIFLELFRDQVIGVTGTKGKSTTVSLLYTILKNADKNVLLGGNIGVPPLDFLDKINPETLVVFEMSSHQLENIRVSPKVAVLLNIFQEHLDHYKSYRDYQLAKYNIARWQKPGDVIIWNGKNELLRGLLSEFPIQSWQMVIHCHAGDQAGARCNHNHLIIDDGSGEICFENFCNRRKLPGEHNLTNILAACLAAYVKGIDPELIRKTTEMFEGLPHRLEFIGERNGARFYNDSISTIPESTIEALKTFPDVHTLLLGGFDRGVDYSLLVGYLRDHPVKKLLFIGKAGLRIATELLRPEGLSNAMIFQDFESAVKAAIDVTPVGTVCLLSPAAASYDMFKNFEHRGEKFRQMILEKDSPA
ncbi:MAG: UDP-N-acetylmuramoyl-L-alanine--D-glutamate ligase [Bacteroidales bacterium]|nr:UDP-N-acetylmuramoyl-L-alanine--D-glutamate ligase [Bacteroidales bacterium]